MNDRDLTTAAIAALEYINPHIIRTKRVVPCEVMEQAIAAALAAIGDRLIPDLPDTAHFYEVTIEGQVPGDEENPPEGYVLEGQGETLAEAVADAMDPDRGLRDEP